MTRAEAIELAVRRHLKSVADRGWMNIWSANNAVPTIVCHAVRTHYRIICKTYGVKDEPPQPVWLMWPEPVLHEPPYYDGHSLRI
jgi:hypothetical protein